MGKTITVKELITELEALDGDAEVHIAYNYGDHWKTQVAPAIRVVEEVTIAWSEYHSMDKVIDDDEIDDAEQRNQNVRQAVILR